jgi:hypothetical protein
MAMEEDMVERGQLREGNFVRKKTKPFSHPHAVSR